VRSAPSLCPACGSAELARIGAGTERLEGELAERLPELALFRLDADTASGEGSHAGILERFAAADRAVLLGTQMVAKGHHFPGVRLAAVVDADAGLLVPDFRAEERTFQLVTQLAGRSGRDGPGRVLVQTFSPDSRPVTLAARHAVAEFLAGELERREELRYPPFRHLVRIVASGSRAEPTLALLRELRESLDGVTAGDELLGPAALLRLRGRHRAALLAKTERPRPLATRAGRLLGLAASAMRKDGLTAVVDVDPQG
jgi:primosomal protein N' (replication factor Y)